MLKKLAVFFALSLLMSGVAHAQVSDLDNAADNINVVPLKDRMVALKSLDQSLDVNLKNATPGQISDIIKNNNLIQNRVAKQQNQPLPEPLNINTNNKQAISDYLKKDVVTYPYPNLND